MAGLVTSLRRLKDGCLHALSSRLTQWTEPLVTSLPLSTLTDLGRSKSELVAGQTVSHHQDRSHPPRPAGQAGSHLAAGPRHGATRDVAPVASGALSNVLEAQVQGHVSQDQVVN
jgi:hypothetical protein